MEPNIWIEIGKVIAPAIIVISVVVPIHTLTNKRIDDSIAENRKRIDDSIRSNREQFQAFLEAWKIKD